MVQIINQSPFFFFVYGHLIASGLCVEKIILYQWPGPSVKNLLTVTIYIYTFGPSFSLIFMPMPYCLDYYSLLISHKIRQVNIFSFVIFKSYFGCSESFVFP